MGIPLIQKIKVAKYILEQKIKGNKKYPLVLMLEPLFRCNLTCAGCGKIDYPDEILNKRMSLKECLEAVDECGAPIVSIPGGEPLVHKEIGEIVQGIIDKGKFVYLCTNAILLEKKLDLFKIKLDSYSVLCVYLGMKCDKCKKIKAVIKYHGGHYCTWYCAKKKS